MVVARDTAFVPGSLHLLARHMTEAVQDGNVDVALTNWCVDSAHQALH